MLYKFYGARNEQDSLKLLKRICEGCTIRASAPSSFNDPFEFNVAVDFDAEEPVIRDRYFADNPNNTSAEYESWRSSLAQSRWWINQSVRSQLLETFGVICLTADYRNHLLWSHYAVDHTGFCVGFTDELASRLPAVIASGLVAYATEAPSFRYYFDPPEEFAKKAFGVKSQCWEYEEEYRICLKHAGIVRFPKTVLREVILGCRAFPALRQYANGQLEKVGFKFYQMSEDFAKFSLTRHPVERDVTLMSSMF